MALTDYIASTLAVIVKKRGEAMFHESATRIEIDDEGAGEFVRVSQCRDEGDNSIAIDIEEWPVIRKAIDEMIGQCRR